MKYRAITGEAVLVSALLFHAAPALSGQAGCEIPFRLDGYLIVVEASIGNKDRLRFMIDTGATGTVVDRKVIKALGAEQMSGESRIAALGQVTRANRFRMPILRIGPVFAELHCHEADLAFLGVDGIIGLDLLRGQKQLASCETNEIIKSGSLTIDFKARKLRFGARQQLQHAVPLEASSSEIIVVAMIQGHPLRLAVDTGCHTIFLYKESQMGWLKPWVMLQGAKVQMLGCVGGGKEVVLPDMELGNSRWTDPTAILMDQPNQAIDGLRPLKQLGLKIVHFDFERNLMSWNK